MTPEDKPPVGAIIALVCILGVELLLLIGIAVGVVALLAAVI